MRNDGSTQIFHSMLLLVLGITVGSLIIYIVMTSPRIPISIPNSQEQARPQWQSDNGR